jgi:hypothetical protein
MNGVLTPRPGGTKAQPGPGWKRHFAGSALIISAAAALLVHDCTPNNQVKAALTDTRPLSIRLRDECRKCCPRNIDGCVTEKRDSMRLARIDSIKAAREILQKKSGKDDDD